MIGISHVRPEVKLEVNEVYRIIQPLVAIACQGQALTLAPALSPLLTGLVQLPVILYQEQGIPIFAQYYTEEATAVKIIVKDQALCCTLCTECAQSAGDVQMCRGGTVWMHTIHFH